MHRHSKNFMGIRQANFRAKNKQNLCDKSPRMYVTCYVRYLRPEVHDKSY